MSSLIHTPALAAECGLDHAEMFAMIKDLPPWTLAGTVVLKLRDPSKIPADWCVLRPEAALEYLMEHALQTPAVKGCQARLLKEVDAARLARGQPPFGDGFFHEG